MSKNEKNKNKNKKEKKSVGNSIKAIPMRINLLFFLIFTLFIILIARLYNMQIVHHDFYLKKLEEAGSVTKVVESTPRGQIYDAKGTVLVSNKAKTAVKFTRSNKISADQMRKVAEKLVTIVPGALENEPLTERDKKDFYLADADNLRKVQEATTTDEKYDKKTGDKLSEGSLYALYISKVTDGQIQYSPEQEEAAKIFKRMNATSNFNTTIVISGDLSDVQVATIAENESKLSGISIGNDWDRDYGKTALRPLLGTISSERAGIPAEDLDEYLSKGYSRNDRVGTSYVEKGYEEYLQGTRKISEVYLDKNGNISDTKVLSDGKPGKNVKLTIDLKFQEGVEDILQKHYQEAKNQGIANVSEGAYAVVLNPDDGSVLAMAGLTQNKETGEITKDALQSFTGSFVPGSVVKGATITAGWQYGVINGNETLIDQPIQIAGSPVKQSWFTNGGSLPINAVQALEYSSNTYMLQITLKMLGQPYYSNMGLDLTNKDKVFEELRKTYGQYGMGVSTGFDIPGESEGLVPPADKSSIGSLLDLSFGQYDNYTTLQLAQYAATVANGGTRYAPHIVSGIYEGSDGNALGKEVKSIDTKEVNKVDISKDDMDIIKEGFYQVVHGDSMATAKDISAGESVPISAKTGTAETFATDANGNSVSTTSNNIVAYAPSNNPQIALGVMIPNIASTNSHINQEIGKDIVNLYNSMYGFK
ncbi:penicillin-binding protein [Floricoccus penangensis]|uniref:Penicillin-binding protein n=1 Tax=Floricoccus penangensis TaxID=1859475 RepID=A0A9Q5JFB3_9LACT|nr:penicillin-binding transpeptidase domain-containing protein [Floricoccus penangensis]OFI45785.1 penicillin-binding protein [Floricoccus penangensis]